MTNRLKNAVQKTADVDIGALSTVTVYKDVIVRVKKLALAMDGYIDWVLTIAIFRPMLSVWQVKYSAWTPRRWIYSSTH
ncbi:hypothetical protein FACS1894110_23070 [Spirochaetia bacterium]|nr:hypothetical protein FACS1894110_23070 [Spirochaetia bacterium]